MYAASSSLRAGTDLRYSDGSYQIRAKVRFDGYQTRNGAWHDIADDQHYIEVLVRHASSSTAADGSLTLWIDGTQVEQLSGVDLYDISKPERMRLGAIFGIQSTTGGTFYVDEWMLRDDSAYIGPVGAANPQQRNNPNRAYGADDDH